MLLSRLNKRNKTKPWFLRLCPALSPEKAQRIFVAFSMYLLHSEQGRWEQGLVQSFDVLSGKLREESKQRQKNQCLCSSRTLLCVKYIPIKH